MARVLYHNMGAPSLEAFKLMLRTNVIKNCPVTVEDVKIAEKIYGPDVATIKRKVNKNHTGTSEGRFN